MGRHGIIETLRRELSLCRPSTLRGAQCLQYLRRDFNARLGFCDKMDQRVLVAVRDRDAPATCNTGSCGYLWFECWRFLKTNSIGELVCNVDDGLQFQWLLSGAVMGHNGTIGTFCGLH